MRRQASEALLASYTSERRPLILDTIEDLSRVTLYMTSLSPSVALMRDAVLSLSLSEPFVHNLFDPFRVPPYTTLAIESTASAKAGDAAFTSGPEIGRVIPDMPASALGGRLFDHLGDGFACIAGGGTAGADQRRQCLFAALAAADPSVTCLGLDDEAGEAFAAGPGTVYLVRPDHHVAGRWLQVEPAGVLECLNHALGRQPAHEPAEAA